jgi:hypothetical protein
MVVEGVGCCQAPLLHRDRSQRRKAHYIADGVDVRDLGLEVLIDGNASAIVCFKTGGGEIEIVDGALAADGVE